MPVPKKSESQKVQTVDEPKKPVAKSQSVSEKIDEDRIDFVNVKDLIKGMEKQKPEKDLKENGFHKKITDNGHDVDKKIEDIDEKIDYPKSEKVLEKFESSDSSESLSRSNSLINGVQVPKPLPRSSISEGGSAEEQLAEVPKPKPRTTAVPVSGYKVHFNLNREYAFIYCFNQFSFHINIVKNIVCKEQSTENLNNRLRSRLGKRWKFVRASLIIDCFFTLTLYNLFYYFATVVCLFILLHFTIYRVSKRLRS